MPDLPWRVAYVRSRQEKEIARLLLRLEVPFYLPLAQRQVRRDGRRFVSFLPLFPGYLFFRGQRDPCAARAPAARRPSMPWDDRVVSVLDVPDPAGLARELRALWHLQQSGAALLTIPYLGPGAAVEVVEGPFKGLRGTVLREKGRTRLVVSVTFLRQSVAAELERDALAPAPAARTPAARTPAAHTPAASVAVARGARRRI